MQPRSVVSTVDPSPEACGACRMCSGSRAPCAVNGCGSAGTEIDRIQTGFSEGSSRRTPRD